MTATQHLSPLEQIVFERALRFVSRHKRSTKDAVLFTVSVAANICWDLAHTYGPMDPERAALMEAYHLIDAMRSDNQIRTPQQQSLHAHQQRKQANARKQATKFKDGQGRKRAEAAKAKAQAARNPG